VPGKVRLVPLPRIAVLGAGPVGLEAALAAAERGWPTTVYESDDQVAGNVRRWGHVRLFTPWAMNVSERMRAALGGDAPDGAALPTGDELAERLYEPAGRLPSVSGSLRLGSRILAVGRERLLKHEEIGSPGRERHPFRLLVAGPDGAERVERADVVIDCTGTYGHPNRLGDGGIPAPGERALDGRITRQLPDLAADPGAWAGQTVLLTGAGHSAQTAARSLAEFARDAAGTRVIWAVRSPEPDWGAVDDDPLPERASLNAAAGELARGGSPAVDARLGVVTDALSESGGRIEATLQNGGPEEVTVDRILALNGGVGDFEIYRQLQVHECYATGAPMKLSAALMASAGGGGDCLAQTSHGPETLLNPEPNFFILGSKSYGRNSQFLLKIGWEQVDDVFGMLDAAAAPA